MPGLHICQISQTGTDGRGEWVGVANDGPLAAGLSDLEITDFTATQEHVHVYRFPLATDGSTLMLYPGQTAWLFTALGRNERLADGDLLLFANRVVPVWNNTGDVAYLRDALGRFVDSMTVGDPARHPNGH
jgi:hypothetical protein